MNYLGFECHCLQLCLSREPLQRTALGTRSAHPYCTAYVDVAWNGKMSIILRAE